MPDGKITSLFGGPTGEKVPNEDTIEILEHYLNLARTGEVCGVILAATHYGTTASYCARGEYLNLTTLGAGKVAIDAVSVQIIEKDGEK